MGPTQMITIFRMENIVQIAGIVGMVQIPEVQMRRIIVVGTNTRMKDIFQMEIIRIGIGHLLNILTKLIIFQVIDTVARDITIED